MWKSIKNTGLILDTYRTVVSAKYQSIYYLTAMDDDRIVLDTYSINSGIWQTSTTPQIDTPLTGSIMSVVD
jgi:hypothetical protein